MMEEDRWIDSEKGMQSKGRVSSRLKIIFLNDRLIIKRGQKISRGREADDAGERWKSDEQNS